MLASTFLVTLECQPASLAIGSRQFKLSVIASITGTGTEKVKLLPGFPLPINLCMKIKEKTRGTGTQDYLGYSSVVGQTLLL